MRLCTLFINSFMPSSCIYIDASEEFLWQLRTRAHRCQGLPCKVISGTLACVCFLLYDYLFTEPTDSACIWRWLNSDRHNRWGWRVEMCSREKRWRERERGVPPMTACVFGSAPYTLTRRRRSFLVLSIARYGRALGI